MGRSKRAQPSRLAAKLKHIRLHWLDMRQEDLMPHIVPGAEYSMRAAISDYERGRRVPSLLELLRYVKLVNETTRYRITCDTLIDDSLDLPE